MRSDGRGSGSVDRDGDVGERVRDRRLRLVHGDRRGLDPMVVEAGRDQPVGERLDQVDRRTGDDLDQPVGELAVVHGVGHVVAGGSGREIDSSVDVDDEVLAGSRVRSRRRRGCRAPSARSA